MTTYFTSDTHFGHERIIELSGRPFATVDEMDEALIDRWNAVVNPTDTVVHLGDLALGTLAVSLPKTRRLNGRRLLKPGNHDRVSPEYANGKQIERFIPIYEDAGWEILHGDSVLELGRFTVALSHYPYVGDHTDADRHVDARPDDLGLPLLHGHIHEQRREDGRMLNVGVDVNDFTPVHEDVVLEWLERVAG